MAPTQRLFVLGSAFSGVVSENSTSRLPCSSIPSRVCGNPSILCYQDPRCDEKNPLPAQCNAGGSGQDCRYCGGSTGVECPAKGTFPKAKVGYKPHPELGGTSRCEKVDSYRLIEDRRRPGTLLLVGVGKDGAAADPEYQPDLEYRFTIGEMGIFTGHSDATNPKHCLRAAHNVHISLNEDPAHACTSENHWKDGLWHFKQGWTGEARLCMGTPLIEHDCQHVIGAENFRVGTADNEANCGPGWTVTVFEGATEVTSAAVQPVRSGAVQPSCDECRKQLGNFSCSTSLGCTLTPDPQQCRDSLLGTWCIEPGKQCHIKGTTIISDIPKHPCSADFKGKCDDCEAAWDDDHNQVNLTCISGSHRWNDNCRKPSIVV